MSLIKKIAFQPGDDIYQQDDDAMNVFLVNEGIVDLIHADDYGKEELIRSVRKGQIFGETALTGNHPRWFTARAKTPVNCVCISVKELNKRVEEQDPFVAGLYRIVAANLNAIREMDIAPEDSLDIMIELANTDDE